MSTSVPEKYKMGCKAGKAWATEYASWEELHKLAEMDREREEKEQEELNHRTEHDPYHSGTPYPNVIHNEMVMESIIKGLKVEMGQSPSEFWKLIGVSEDIGGDLEFMEGFIIGAMNVAIHVPAVATKKGASN